MNRQSSDGAERFGGLERFAVERALRSAQVTEFWAPAEQEFRFVDYFEAAAARNLALLNGFEQLGEDIERRGIVPQPEGEQARLVTDGGSEQHRREIPNADCPGCDDDFVLESPEAG